MTDALRPRPATTPDTSFFWEGARAHRLLIQRCTSCGVLRHPPTAGCAGCGRLGWEAVESSGHGEVFSYTVVHSPVRAPFVSGHIVGLVQLQEGVRLVSEIVDVEPGQVVIGTPVTCDWLECDPDLTVPVFRRRRGK